MSRYRHQYNKYLEEHFRLRYLIDKGIEIGESQTHLNALTAKIQWCDEMATIEALKERRIKRDQIVEEIEYQYLQA